MSPGIGIGIAPHEILQTMSVGPPPFRFDIVEQVFTAYMAKRAGQGPFAAAPIVQGDFDGSGVPDVLSFPRGNLIGNQTQLQYANFDPYQGAAVKWWTPEKDRTAAQTNDEYVWYINANYNLRYEHDNQQLVATIGTQSHTDALVTVAGTLYCTIVSWDYQNTIDGTNYIRISINDTHDFGASTAPTASAPDATIYLGSNAGTTLPLNAILEGLTIYRRPLFDGTYGVRPQNGNQYSADEINAIWNAGAGRDPTLVTGSEDVCFCLPTDSAQEILATGTGEAWSWPWEDNLPDVWGAWDGGLPGTDRAVEFNGTTTEINCGSDVDIDDIQDDAFTAEAWLRVDAYGAVSSFIFSKARWNFLYTNTELIADVDCVTTDALSIISASNIPVDGKWHHYTMFFDDAGDRKIYLAVDGVWAASYDTQDAGVGAIVTDAGDNLIIGNRAAADRGVNGAFAWAAISNNDRHTVGTDFIPPRAFPADDANYLASWPMDEGAGVAIDNIGNQGGAGSGAANRDGVLANGAWSSIWEQDATPVIPQSVEFDGAATIINCGSDAGLDDLADDAFTADGWVRLDTDASTGSKKIINKGWTASGWGLSHNNALARFYGEVDCATTDAISYINMDLSDGRWHHVAMFFDDAGDRKVYIAIDGIWGPYGLQQAGVGAIVSDAAEDLYIGRRGSVATEFWDGAIGWLRISDNDRHSAGTNFVPDARTNPPASDGNTLAQWNFTEGAGATLDNIEGTAARDGTLANGVWHNTPDMEIDEPGAAIYGPKGYNLGVDAALEGMYIEQAVVAETDYVVFPVLSIGESGRARPRIRIYDVSNAGDVVIFNGPMLYGTHTGGNGSPDLIPTNPRWIADALIDGAVYNITDGSAAPISDNNEDIVTAGLGGGVDNDWDNGDVFVIRMPRGYCERPWQESFCFQVPQQCALLRIYIENVNAEGVMQIHQVQVLPNVFTGDMEVGAGNPWIPTGWTNLNLDAGDSLASSGGGGIIHSGADAIQFAVGASNEKMYYAPASALGFYAIGAWSYGDGTVGMSMTGNANNTLLQYSIDTNILLMPVTAQWSYVVGVHRNFLSGGQWAITALAGAAGARYFDDHYLVALDDVSLTVTPASEANSLEAGGLRIDGRDISDQPVAELRFNMGWIWCNARPRHETGEALDFGQTREYIFDCFENAANYIRVWRTTNLVWYEYNASGAGAVTGNWISTGLWDEDVDVEIWAQYGASGAYLYIDGVERVALPGPVIFATDFTAAIHWGHDINGELQFDGVIS